MATTSEATVDLVDIDRVLPVATPRPWRVFKTDDGRKLIGVGAADGGGILDAGFGVWSWNDAEGIANAELAVRAVNSLEPHVAAIAVLRPALQLARAEIAAGRAAAAELYDVADEVGGDPAVVTRRLNEIDAVLATIDKGINLASEMLAQAEA